jgi:hypothetical protein
MHKVSKEDCLELLLQMCSNIENQLLRLYITNLAGLHGVKYPICGRAAMNKFYFTCSLNDGLVTALYNIFVKAITYLTAICLQQLLLQLRFKYTNFLIF